MIKAIFGWLKWLLLALWVALLILVGAKLAQQNSELIQVDLLVWELPAASTGFVLLVTLLVGVALGLVAIMPGLLYLRFKLKRVNNRLRKAEQSSPSLLSQGPADG